MNDIHNSIGLMLDACQQKLASDGVNSGYHTVLSARRYLARILPGVKNWVCWPRGMEKGIHVFHAFLGQGIRERGRIGDWSWERVASDSEVVHFCDITNRPRELGCGWLGLIHIQGAGGEDFYIYAYYTDGENFFAYTAAYICSTDDVVLLRRFSADVLSHVNGIQGDRKIRINVVGGQDLFISRQAESNVFLPQDLMDDIDQQVAFFFENGEYYKRMKVPYRRGLLFAGAPGTGKTMMLRRLARMCHVKYGAICHALSIDGQTDLDDVQDFFLMGSGGSPAFLIIDDIESLVKETKVTRSGLLAQLDGLEARSGALVIATANRPEQIDPALIHRPSRFDRVWTFPLPSLALRQSYLREFFPHLPEEVLADLAQKTSNWTIAYLKEIGLTAGMIAIGKREEEVSAKSLTEAFRRLKSQFNAGQKIQSIESTAQATVLGFAPPKPEDSDAIPA